MWLYRIRWRPAMLGLTPPSSVAHTPEQVWRGTSSATSMTSTTIAERHGAKLLPFAVETCGGLAPDAVAFVRALAEDGDEQLSLWSKDSISEHIHASVAIAVQAANALMYARVRGGAQPSSAG